MKTFMTIAGRIILIAFMAVLALIVVMLVEIKENQGNLKEELYSEEFGDRLITIINNEYAEVEIED
jgi:uncharacterized membrane protein